jgi:hypothetical protein
VPEAAVLLAVRVTTLVVVAGFTLKAAVTPEGSPEAARVTPPENPFTGVIVSVLLPPFAPLATVSVVGDAERLKLCARVTVRLIVVVWVRLPDVPVMVTVAVPPVAVAAAVNVNVLVDVPGFGLKLAVTPLGRPEAENVTLPLNPFVGVIVTVLVPLVPWTSVKLPGDAEMLKLGTAVTVRLIVVVWVMLPDVPVMVTVVVPGDAVALAANVTVLVLVAGFGLKLAVTPAGNPDAARVTLPLKPLDGVIVMVLVPLVPCTTLRLLGDAERL